MTQKALFTGSYNINNENAQSGVDTFDCLISINEKGDNILSAQSQSVNKKNTGRCGAGIKIR